MGSVHYSWNPQGTFHPDLNLGYPISRLLIEIGHVAYCASFDEKQGLRLVRSKVQDIQHDSVIPN